MYDLWQWPSRVAAALADVGRASGAGEARPSLAPTPRTVIQRQGGARLLRFDTAATSQRAPILIVPSLINRWYIVDLRPGATLVGALVAAGHPVYCLDWGVPGDEDRYLTWDEVLARLRRAVRAVRRDAGAARVALLGYCMGGTLAAIHTALHPERIRALVNLAGPIDFSDAGQLGRMVDPAWFDADAIAEAGNVSPLQMQSGFIFLKPAQQLSKWVKRLEHNGDTEFLHAFEALETWADDNIAFPAAAYRTYIGDLYQRNALVAGTHRVAGRTVHLSNIDCPVLTITASHDHICPPASATALNEHAASADTEVLEVPGGHIGAVVGHRATRDLYPRLAEWLTRHNG